MGSLPCDKDTLQGEVYLAGERVPSGYYHQIGTRRRIFLPQEDYLPASLDGRVACYERLDHIWCQTWNRDEPDSGSRRQEDRN